MHPALPEHEWAAEFLMLVRLTVVPTSWSPGMTGDGVAGTGAAPLDISRMGGPQRAERGGAALMSAAERATAPQPAPVAFQEVSSVVTCMVVEARIGNSGWTISREDLTFRGVSLTQ